jgi:Spy/CpxP family protein refolding chaperone
MLYMPGLSYIQNRGQLPGKMTFLKGIHTMKSKLSQKFTTSVIVFFIIICFVPALAIAGNPVEQRQGKEREMKGHHGPSLGIWRNPQMVQKLALTENQVKQIKDMDFSFRERHLTLKAQLDSFHLQLDKAFFTESIDDTAVLKIAQKISDVRGSMFVLSVESRLSLGKILTADQIKKMSLYDMQPERKGPGHCGERKPCRQG